MPRRKHNRLQEIATSAFGLLAMTHQAVSRCTSALARLNSPVQGAHNPQGARRIRKAAKPPTAAQGTPLQTQSVGTFYRYPVRPGSASPRLPRVQSTLAMTSLWRLPFYRQPVSCAGAVPGPAVPAPAMINGTAAANRSAAAGVHMLELY